MIESFGRFGLGISNCRSAQDVVSGVRLAEELGAEVAFISEDIGCRDAFALASLAARETSRVTLSTGVVNPYTRNPMALATGAATLDEISQGRAQLGLGTSSPSLIEDAMGIPAEHPVRVMREATEIVRALLTGRPVTYEGKHFNYKDAELTVHPIQPRVPVFFAAMGPQMLRLTGQIADGVLLNVGASTRYVRWAVGHIREGALQADRDPGEITVAAWLSTYVTEEYEPAMQRAREWLATMLSIPRQGELLLTHTDADPEMLAEIRRLVSGYPHAGDRTAAAQHIPTDLTEELALIGTAVRVRERIQEYRAAGVDLPVMGISAVRSLFAS